jgi:hypothetical protein
VHASVGEVEILKVGKITELRRHHNTVERIPDEIVMLQVSQTEQRSWYLAFKKCSTRALEYWVIVGGRASTKDAIIIRIAQIAGGSRGLRDRARSILSRQHAMAFSFLLGRCIVLH